ncbi:hypothetical protein PV08_04183 [Exophiala spinifera]|uniref:Heterokaryon incompatibility domain-containing protein n=1 Tax=Exophiala spinifera TaxID=91928 RepID=A0A0D1ZWF3_9EURO|nr:uncharacterized protein PV08_04183 [Exophiala spinifera]KIW16992.1 hypothetical protein PV08_04183 [Exophiala spinifera]
MTVYSPVPQSPYRFTDIETETSFRVLELLHGKDDEPISCLLHLADWTQPPAYEALSYAWGDRKMSAAIKCHGKRLEVGRNLHTALAHLRLPDRSRFLWVDCLCMNQTNIPERNQQVKQMRRIYAKATAVLTWLGPDSPDRLAKTATDAVRVISDFLCARLNIQIANLSTRSNVYQEILYENRRALPPPNECDFSSGATWQALNWFYSHSYFTRLWIIQEINASTNRIVHCGREKIEWDHVDLVAGYMIMDTAFSNNFGFSKTHCWWAATVTTERMRTPKNWLSMLYLASNFSCEDDRDMIYGLRGLMELPEPSEQAALLNPDYAKSSVEVFRDSVEAAFLDFQNTDVLLYLVGDESPSWIPRWERSMLFRNPFRFGKSLPWKPASDSKPQYRIDTGLNVLHLSGFLIDTIQSVYSYNERYFSNAMLNSGEGREELQQAWPKILGILADSQQPPSSSVSTTLLTAVATALSFGVDADANPADPQVLLYNFIAYLSLILPPEIYAHYIPSDLSEAADAKGNGDAFGKPVWDFAYPESGFFITSTGLVGCSVCVPQQGDLVIAALGSTYPSVIRPWQDGERFLIRGYAFVDGAMRGERAAGGEIRVFDFH